MCGPLVLNEFRPRLAFYLRGRQKFVRIIIAAARRNRIVAFPASPVAIGGAVWISNKNISKFIAGQ